jgi:hypothetical protein
MLQSGRDGLIPGGLVEDDRLLTVLSTRVSFGGPDTRVDPSVAGIASSGIVDRRLLDR